MKEVLIHYCGGCNPHYDRTALVRRLQAAFPRFAYVYQAERTADLALVVCGCSAACPARHGGNAAARYVITDEADWAGLQAALSRLERAELPETAQR